MLWFKIEILRLCFGRFRWDHPNVLFNVCNRLLVRGRLDCEWCWFIFEVVLEVYWVILFIVGVINEIVNFLAWIFLINFMGFLFFRLGTEILRLIIRHLYHIFIFGFFEKWLVSDLLYTLIQGFIQRLCKLMMSWAFTSKTL